MKKIILIILFLSISNDCFAAKKFSSLEDLASQLPGKIALSSSNNIILIDLDEKDISYLIYEEAYASNPKWGPNSKTLTYFQHKVLKSWTSINNTDKGNIQTLSINNEKDILVRNIPIRQFRGFSWSSDRKRLVYIQDKQLHIVSNKGAPYLIIDLFDNTTEKLAWANNPIFSKNDKSIFFTGMIDNNNPPFPEGLYEFNIENKTIHKIRQASDIMSLASSPNGQQIAYITERGLYLLDNRTNAATLLKKIPSSSYNFTCWSPDGSKILYGYPRGFWRTKDPLLEVHMIDFKTKKRTILIHEKLLKQEINIEKLRCNGIDWTN